MFRSKNEKATSVSHVLSTTLKRSRNHEWITHFKNSTIPPSPPTREILVETLPAHLGAIRALYCIPFLFEEPTYLYYLVHGFHQGFVCRESGPIRLRRNSSSFQDLCFVSFGGSHGCFVALFMGEVVYCRVKLSNISADNGLNLHKVPHFCTFDFTHLWSMQRRGGLE